MKRFVQRDSMFGMANLNPQKSGLGNIVIWSDHGGILRNVSHRENPRVKLSIDDMFMSVTIESDPKILAKSRNISKKDISKFSQGIKYVGRNHDLFLKHYMDANFEFDDEDLFQALRDRKEYR